MNIQEAIKSGKRYRRKGELDWYDTAPDFTHHAFSTQDVLSSDWEVEEKTVTITREQLYDAWLKALSLNELAKELGL